MIDTTSSSDKKPIFNTFLAIKYACASSTFLQSLRKPSQYPSQNALRPISSTTLQWGLPLSSSRKVFIFFKLILQPIERSFRSLDIICWSLSESGWDESLPSWHISLIGLFLVATAIGLLMITPVLPHGSDSRPLRLKLLDLRKRKAGISCYILQRKDTVLKHPLRHRQHGLALDTSPTTLCYSFYCFAHGTPPFF